MVPGEKPILYQQGTVDVYISKEKASKLSSRSYQGQGAIITVPDYCDMRPEDCEQADTDQLVISVSVRFLLLHRFVTSLEWPLIFPLLWHEILENPFIKLVLFFRALPCQEARLSLTQRLKITKTRLLVWV